ncbi:MAG TPA: methylated-DNA--[protein]-cysteine S-methyltransferase [Bryobacteraceae bacterium]|jgi:methylated-DNA-[protein]-cysteine S-methyltransferase
MYFYSLLPHPTGVLSLIATDEGLEQIHFDTTVPEGAERRDDHPVLAEAARQLNAYFVRDLHDFDLPLAMKGTPFQLRVWRALQEIPYGQTRSYAQQARVVGAPDAVRAVGAANGRNPIPIVVPCHRVIGSNGKLTGFGGGLPLKRWLLDLESNPRLPLL